MKIANEIYYYIKGAADGKFKHPLKGIKMVLELMNDKEKRKYNCNEGEKSKN